MSSTDHVILTLTSVLRDLGRFDHPNAVARELLKRDSRVFSLLGLVDHGSRAVYYDWPTWTVRRVTISTDGVRNLPARDSVYCHHLGRVETYIEQLGRDEWHWLHPRYDWVFQSEDDGPSRSRE